MYLSDAETAGYSVSAAEIVPNLLSIVPVRPAEHEEAVLAAAAFIDDHGLTPSDAIHAGIAHVEGEQVLSTEGAYDDAGIDRVDPDGSAKKEQ